jgi:hypothetical protein
MLRPGEGIGWYSGVPGCGKTTRALLDAGELVRALGWPVLIIDSTRATQFLGYPHEATPEACFAKLYGSPRAHAVITPERQEEVEALCRGVRAGKRVVVLVDESAFWFNASTGRQGELLRLMRGWRHAELRLLLTTQHLSGDVPQEAWSCAPRVNVYRQGAPAAFDVLRKRFGIEPEEVAQLEVGAFVSWPRDAVRREKLADAGRAA